MNEREQLAKDNGMTIEFVNWFFDNKKDGCGNTWFIMMAAMWEGWSGREAKCASLAAENAGLKRNLEGTAEFCYSEIPETPATDAFLAEVRAQGVEMFAGEIGDYAKGKSQATAEIIKAIGRNALRFAAQLRQEAAQ